MKSLSSNICLAEHMYVLLPLKDVTSKTSTEVFLLQTICLKKGISEESRILFDINYFK